MVSDIDTPEILFASQGTNITDNTSMETESELTPLRDLSTRSRYKANRKKKCSQEQVLHLLQNVIHATDLEVNTEISSTSMEIDTQDLGEELLFEDTTQENGRFCDPIRHSHTPKLPTTPKFNIPLLPLAPLSKPVPISPRPSSPRSSNSPRTPIKKSPRNSYRNRRERKSLIHRPHSVTEHQIHLREMQEAIRDIESANSNPHLRKTYSFTSGVKYSDFSYKPDRRKSVRCLESPRSAFLPSCQTERNIPRVRSKSGIRKSTS